MAERFVIRACRNGHPQSYVKGEKFNDRVENDEEPLVAGFDHCPTCGAETTFRCPGCTRPVTKDIPTNIADKPKVPVKKVPLDGYCPGCGESYPWTQPVEQEEVREGEFIEIPETEINGYFYQELVEEINQCYRVQANEATFILYRKLLESLIYDVLSLYCDPAEQIDLYYDTERGRKHQFSTLLESLKEKSGDLHKFSDPINDHEFHEQIADFKENGDTSAHSKENLVTDEQVDEMSDEATHVAKVMFDLRRRLTAGVESE